MNFELYIDELVLHGFDPIDRYAIAASIERELSQLLHEQGIPSFLSGAYAISRIDGGAYSMKKDTRIDVVGRQIAQRIYGGIRP